MRKIFTVILLVYGFNLLERLISMDKQFLDSTLDTSASVDAAIIFLVYSGLILLVALLILIVGWPFKWLRYSILLFVLLMIGLGITSIEFNKLSEPLILKIQTMLQATNLPSSLHFPP